MFKQRTATQKKINSSGDGAPSAQDMAEMSFLEHLEELRWRIIKGLLGVLLGIVLCMFFYRWVIDVLLLGPADPGFFMYRLMGIELEDFILQNRSVTGQFWAAVGTVGVVGLIVGMPILLYQLWAFVEPGLYPKERARMRFTSVFATFFFLIGVAFGYLILTPLALNFFSSFEVSEVISNEFDITKYFGMITLWTFGAGILFELPVVVYFLSKLGMLTPALMRRYRRYAIVVILVLAAFLTPPDPITQIFMAIPLSLLYEGSIWISAVVERKRKKELEAALA